MKPVTRNKLNITIDIIMFVVMVALAVIGFIMRYILIPGSERWEKYGRNIDLTWWGLDRHEWGFIHMLLGILIVILLVLHIIFHWKLIVCLVRRLIPGKKVRYITVAAVIMISILIAVTPFFLKPETGEPIRRQGEGYGRVSTGGGNEYSSPQEAVESGIPEKKEEGVMDDVPETGQEAESKPEDVKEYESHEEHEEDRILDIKGYHTIGELAATYNISAEKLKEKLNIPPGVPNNERLGRIRRVYGFTMREVEDYILELQESGKN